MDELKVGMVVKDREFKIVSYELKSTVHGDPYLRMELKDKTGKSIKGLVFKENNPSELAEELRKEFNDSLIAKISGKVDEFKGDKKLTIQSLIIEDSNGNKTDQKVKLVSDKVENSSDDFSNMFDENLNSEKVKSNIQNRDRYSSLTSPTVEIKPEDNVQIEFDFDLDLNLDSNNKNDDSNIEINNKELKKEEMVDLSNMNVIHEFINSIEHPDFKKILKLIFEDDTINKQFQSTPAGKKWHHIHKEGLLEHTTHVTQACSSVYNIYENSYERLDRDVLITAALLHDIGKIEELRCDDWGNEYTEEGRLTNHVVIGYHIVRSIIDKNIEKTKDNEVKIKKLLHCIVSHTGEFYADFCKPMTLESMILHFCDNMDAMVDGSNRKMYDDGKQSTWTPYVKLLERYLYKK